MSAHPDVPATPGRPPRRRAHLGARAALSVLALVAAVIALAPAAGAAPDNYNDPAYWQGQGYGTCVKYDPVSTPYVLGAAPSGYTWSLLVLKAGSEASNSDWLTQIQNPSPGTYYHPSGKSISHVIVCRKSGSGGGSTTTTSTPGGGCGTYMPTNVAINPTHGQPGDTLLVTGTGSPADIVTVSISGNSQPATTIGSTTVTAGGSFSVAVVIPDTFTAGSYTLSVKSAQCPTPRTLTVIVDSLDLSGCGPNGDRVFTPGEVVVWTVMGNPFDTAKPITVRLVPRGPGSGTTATLYSGAFPGSGNVTITIPSSVTQEKYFLDQVGVQKNNKKTMTKSCPVRVSIAYVLASTDDASGPATYAAAAGKASLVLVAGLLLVVLRSHAPRRRRRRT